MAVYTSGDWHVKQGKEQEFVDAWREFADWTAAEYDKWGWAKLLRDKDDPSFFRSIGEWADEQTIIQWRGSEGFAQRIAKLRDLTDEMRVANFEVAVEIGARVGAWVMESAE